MSFTHHFLLLSLLLPIVTARPPGRSDQEKKMLSGGEPLELDDYVDYFEDFFPVLTNSTKLHENYQYEKKKYLTAVLGFPAKMRKMT